MELRSPLSFGQERLWFLHRLAPQSAAYNETLGLRLHGALDLPALAGSLRHLMQRHEVLRTTYGEDGGTPWQRIGGAAVPPLHTVDLTGLSAGRREEEARRRLTGLAGRAIDLARGPLWRATLMRLAAREHLLGFLFHHSIFDEASAGILLRELTLLYGALAAAAARAPSAPGLPGSPARQALQPLKPLKSLKPLKPLNPLKTPRWQYRDHVAWQRARQDSAAGRRQLAAWRQQLAGWEEDARLAPDHPHRGAPGRRGARRHRQLPAALVAPLAALGRQQGASGFIVLLAVWMEVLYRHTGERRLAVGTAAVGRNRLESEGLIGFFVNSLVLRLSRPEAATFRDLLALVRQTTLAALEMQETPFERVVAELQPASRLVDMPLFQVAFTVRAAPPPLRHLGVLAATPWEIHGGGCKLDLLLDVEIAPHQLRCSAEYDRDVFDPASIERLIDHFARLLEQVLDAPERRLAELPLIGPAERHQVLCEWSGAAAAVAWPLIAAAPPVAWRLPAAAAARLTAAVPPVAAAPGTAPAELGSTDAVSLVSLLAAQAARRPDAVAVEEAAGARCLSYGALAGRAERWAGELRRRGVAAEGVVAIWPARSLEMVAALAAVLRAGAGYLPLDPQAPVERLGRILGDSGACLILAPAAMRDRLPRLPRPPGVEVLALEDLARAAAGREPVAAAGVSSAAGAAAPVGAVSPDETGFAAGAETTGDTAGEGSLPPPAPEQLACLFYTSGSTGRPKGVAVPHAAVVHLVQDGGHGSYDEHEVFLHAAPLAFDASTFEIWTCLGHGARLVLFPDHPPALAELHEVLAAHAVSTLLLTADLFHAVADEDPRALAPVRQLLAGGDVLQPAAVGRVAGLLPAMALRNGYGPTENTTLTTCHRVRPDDPRTERVPIGRPIGGTRVHVLDGALRAVPIGVAGELCLAGRGLARGYLNDPAATAERFVPDPAGAAPGGRLYRTGDRVRWLAGGELDFLGRLDRQVKVRGHRIEPQEVEAVLGEHPAVARAVVLLQRAPAAAPAPAPQAGPAATEAKSGVPAGEHRGEEGVRGRGLWRLVAHVEPVRGAAASGPDLAAFTASRLPPHMVPAAWVVVPRLPRLPSGKVDRRALSPSAPGLSAVPKGAVAAEGEAAAPADGVAPLTPHEAILAGLWDGLLGVAPTRGGDDFFALGGHSLLAIRLLSRLRSVLGVELPLRTLFEAPTLAAMAAAVVAARRGTGAGAGLPPLGRMARPAAPPLSFEQERIWRREQLPSIHRLTLYNLPARLSLAGRLDVAALRAALAALQRRHESLRTSFRPLGQTPCQIVEPASHLPLPVIDLSALPAGAAGRAARDLAVRQARRPFDLAAAPLARTALLRLAPRRHELLVTLHHIVADGWSFGVLRHDLAALYGAARAGRPSPRPAGRALRGMPQGHPGRAVAAKGGSGGLPELPVQFVDFALWQRAWLQGEALDRLAAYWRRQLAAMPRLELPADRPRPKEPSFRGRTRFFRLPAALTVELERLSRGHGVTLFMTLLAGFQAVAARTTGENDVAVATVIANRPRLELEPLIGLLINLLVLRTRLDPAAGFGTLVAQVRDVVLRAHEHRDMPFDRLVEELESAGAPPVHNLFALQEAPDRPFSFAGLRGTMTVEPAAAARADVGLQMAPLAGGLGGWIEYSSDLFDPATIARLAGHYERLLAGAAADPSMPLARLPLLSAAERHQVLWERTGDDRVAPVQEPGATGAPLPEVEG